MIRRLFGSRLVLRRLFSETTEAAEDVALTKAGLLIQKVQPKTSFVKKSIFIKPPPKEKEELKIEKTEKRSTSSDSESPEQKDIKYGKDGRPINKKDREKGAKAPLPTAAESLKEEVPPYEFPSNLY